MESTGNHPPEAADRGRPTPARAAAAGLRDGSPPQPADRTAHPEQAADRVASPPPAAPPYPPGASPRSRRWRKWVLAAVVVAGLAGAGYALVPWVDTELNTVSTDDAYVN